MPNKNGGLFALVVCVDAASARMLVTDVADAKNKIGQSCFAENNSFKVIYCDCETQETSTGAGTCRDDSYSMVTSGWCEIKGGGDGIGTAFCVGAYEANTACVFCNCKGGAGLADFTTRTDISPLVLERRVYNTSRPNNYQCGTGYTMEYGCSSGSYVYSYLKDGTTVEECGSCEYDASFAVGFHKEGHETCYMPKGDYTDTTGKYTLTENCPYTK